MRPFYVIDIGTTKLTITKGGIVGKKLQIPFLNSYASGGIKKGKVFDMETLTSVIKKAVDDTEKNFNEKIRKATLCYSGTNIKGIFSTGTTRIKRKAITEDDINSAVEAATAINLPPDREVIHIIPVEFIVDGNSGIKDPIGMKGLRLEARVYIITVDANQIHNIITCCSRSGIEVEDLILHSIASSEAVLNSNDREIGTIVIDIGGGTTDIAVFHDGHIRHVNSLGIGGNHFTNDLVIGLKIAQSEAERIKKFFGVSLPKISSLYKEKNNDRGNLLNHEVKKDEPNDIEVIGLDRQTLKIPVNIIREIIYARSEEIFEVIKEEIISLSEDFSISSIVFTGGASLMRGLIPLAEGYLSIPSRLGNSEVGISSLINEMELDEHSFDNENNTSRLYSAEYSSAIGSLIYKIRANSFSNGHTLAKSLFEKFTTWIKDLIAK